MILNVINIIMVTLDYFRVAFNEKTLNIEIL